jgi:hypothetical protein
MGKGFNEEMACFFRLPDKDEVGSSNLPGPTNETPQAAAAWGVSHYRPNRRDLQTSYLIAIAGRGRYVIGVSAIRMSPSEYPHAGPSMLKKRLRTGLLTLLAATSLVGVVNRSAVRGWVVGWPSDSERRLQDKLTTVQFENVPFDAALDRFSQSTHLILDVDWSALESAGVSRKTRVRLRLEDVSVATALDELLLAGCGTAVLYDYEVSPDDRILIGDSQLSRTNVTRLYDLRDLLQDDLRWRGESDPIAVRSLPQTPASKPSSLRQAFLCFFSPPTTAPTSAKSPAAELMDDYARYFSIRSDSEREDLPHPNVRVAGRFLVITARPSQHARISALLADLRRSSRPIRRVEPEPGQALKEANRAGHGLFGH